MCRKIILYSLFILVCLNVRSQKIGYRSFDNITLDTEASAINCFAQDMQGMIWMGSNRGLYSYDGFVAQRHISEQTETQIYCISVIDREQMVLGTDNGVFFYNYQTDRYIESEIDFPTDVRAMTINDNTLWIGSLHGLFKYDLSKKVLEKVQDEKVGIPHKTIYSIIKSDKDMYIGTYNGLCRYVSEKNKYEVLDLPYKSKRSNQFVNVLLEDKSRNCIWIGTEGNLFKYIPSQNRIESLDMFSHNSVKSLAVDHTGNLLVGTDDGLYVYTESNGKADHIVHDSRNSRSLTNNIIWSIFKDKEGNIWLGTDYNISLSRYDKSYQFIPISQLTGVGDGNRFHAIFRDTRHNYWLGGTNGLIFTPSLSSPEASVWYRMGDSKYPLSHNRIRHIYEDKDKDLWIATDGSISRYDYQRRQFVNYSIVDSTHTYNSNWAYNIFDDNSGRLWIATCLGGIFVVDKNKLLQSSGTYLAETNYTMKDGLPSNFVNQILPDKNGNVWALLYRNGICKIDTKQGKIHRIATNNKGESETPNFILCDKEGFIWAAFPYKIIRIDPYTNELKAISFSKYMASEVLTMVEEGQHIWISTANGVWVLDTKTYEMQRSNITNKAFTAGFYDSISEQIYFGSSDEVALLNPISLKEKEPYSPIILTALYVNDKLHNKHGIRYIDHIELTHDENNLVFMFSDLIYSYQENNKFVYKLENLDKDWNIIGQNSNRISYTNLAYGTYRLLITKLDASGKPSDVVFSFDVEITPPWYYTVWAKGIYALLILAFIAWIVNFFRVKNNLRIERIEKEKTLELTNMKMDFFTNVSHEFKTPLSMILAPVSKLMLETKDSHKKKQLEIVQKSALKLNSLIRQIIDFNRSDDTNSGLILSKVEFVEFAHSLFLVYEENYRNLTFSFTSDKDKIYINIDVLKVEAVLNNLLSNACKYTEQGQIALSLSYNEVSKLLAIGVSDTGIGIPVNEIPFVFKRFYQSSKTVKEKEGTGVGLYLVKTYTEQHGGKVDIASEDGKGTSIIVYLPVLDDLQDAVESAHPTENSDLPKVLIVEDNPDIADFISQALTGKYQYQVCHNGKQGFETAIQFVPDLIIADVMMPIMDGMEMTKQLKKNVSTSTIPIILLTAKDDKKTEMESIALNVDVFISKPFDVQMLLSRIDQLLKNKKQIESKIRIETLTSPKPIEATSPDERLLSEITNLIEDKLSDPDLNVAFLSTKTNVGAKQIYRKVKQLTGLSPVEYIRSIRLKKAAMLLSQNKFSITEVMYMVGFSDHSYFSKSFQSEFGKTPRQFLDDILE